MVARVKCAGFDGRQQEHRASVFFSDGGVVELAGTDADRVLNAMEDFAGYHRSWSPEVCELRLWGVHEGGIMLLRWKRWPPLVLSGKKKEERPWAKSGRSTPRSLPKALKKPRRLPASTGLETIEKCRRMTNRDLSSIHRSPPRGPKRPRKPRVPSEPKAAANSKRSLSRSDQTRQYDNLTSGLPADYHLDLLSDPCVIILRRPGERVVARFSPFADPKEIRRTAEEDRERVEVEPDG